MVDTNNTPVMPTRSNVARAARAVTRPIISIIFAGVIAQVVIEGIEAPQWFLTMAGVVIIEWWAERAITRIRGKE